MSAENGGYGAQRLDCKIKLMIIDTVIVSTALCYAQVIMVSNHVSNAQSALSSSIGYRFVST